MPLSRQEVESPMLYDWLFEDELGIKIDIGRFIVPAYDGETIGAKMGEAIINDGRRVVYRTQTFRLVDSREIKFHGMPYNYVQELKNRVGVIFQIRDCFGDFIWAVLTSMEKTAIHGGAWAKVSQLYSVTLSFTQINPT